MSVSLRCAGLTLAGFPCMNYCSINDPYCWRHYYQDPYYDPYYEEPVPVPIVEPILPIVPLGSVYNNYAFARRHTAAEHPGSPVHSGMRSGGRKIRW